MIVELNLKSLKLFCCQKIVIVTKVLQFCFKKTFSQIRPTPAQFLVFSSLGSSKLKRFIDENLPFLSTITKNKLEASNHGQTNYVVDECGCERFDKMNKILKQLKVCVDEDKNTSQSMTKRPLTFETFQSKNANSAMWPF